jgi:BirA family biotin operon repressor/biotin-[acetyl-CoA-carboxylase] ligase
VETVDEIDSTNRELGRRAAGGAPEGLVLVARHQTAGRGRRDRRWEAPKDASLLVSVLLRPEVRVDDLHLVTFAAGLAALEAVEVSSGLRLSLKWPNDVVHDDGGTARKVAGLLAETVLSGSRVDALIVGMGMNVNWDVDVSDGGLALNQLLGRRVDAAMLLDVWLDRFDQRYGTLSSASGRQQMLEEYRRACSTLGRRVRVEHDGGATEGTAETVDDGGHLVLSGPEPRSFAVGDVVHLRTIA